MTSIIALVQIVALLTAAILTFIGVASEASAKRQ